MTGSAPGTASLSGLIIGVTSIAGAIAAALIGRVSGRIGYGRTLLGCLAGAFIFSLPQALARDPYTLLALRAGAGIFMGGTMPSVNALIAQLCDPARQGSTYGLSSSMSSVGGALGPVLGAFAATAFGYPSVFWVTSALLGLIAGGIALALGRRQAAMEAASPAAAAAEGAGIRRPGGVDELRS
ncbi:MAG TPA: MFS transporter, partial [Spirochaetales bacterium]|nr:MFS transporter [Spirochaetales bacterium]